MSKPREIHIYERKLWTEVSLAGGLTRDWIAHRMIEKSAYDKAIDELKKVIKENTVMLNFEYCDHDWEPDTSLTMMRCDKCGIGLNTFNARETLRSLGKIE